MENNPPGTGTSWPDPGGLNFTSPEQQTAQSPHTWSTIPRFTKSTPQAHCSHRVLVVPPPRVDCLEDNPWELLRGQGQLLHLLVQLPAGQKAEGDSNCKEQTEHNMRSLDSESWQTECVAGLFGTNCLHSRMRTQGDRGTSFAHLRPAVQRAHRSWSDCKTTAPEG